MDISVRQPNARDGRSPSDVSSLVKIAWHMHNRKTRLGKAANFEQLPLLCP
jgi:hypothetical protein